MMKAAYFLAMAISLLSVVLATDGELEDTTTTTEEPWLCYYHGEWYPEGMFDTPNPCYVRCYCDREYGVSCPAFQCPPPPCVDAVHSKERCCPYCPNGPSCIAHDGTVIRDNQELQVGDFLCKCVSDLGRYADCRRTSTPRPTLSAEVPPLIPSAE